jgi:hypothetical protein
MATEQRSKAWEDEASFDKSSRNTFSFNLFNKYFKGPNFYHVRVWMVDYVFVS